MAHATDTNDGITAAPSDFQATKLDKYDNPEEAPENLETGELDEEIVAAARSAGINLDSEDGVTPAASGPEGTSEDDSEDNGAATGPEGAATGPEGTETPEGAATGPEGAASGPEGVSGPSTSERDSDLSPRLNPNTHPKTREVIESFKTKAVEARNERDRLAAELEELRAKPAGQVPDDVKTELETLRTRVRELDVRQDPTIQAKYDAKIAANTESVIALLKDHGLGEDAEGKPIEGFWDSVKKGGITLKSMLPNIKALEEAGEIEAAEELKDLLRANNRLEKEKETEIQDWTKNYEQRQKAAEEDAQRQTKEFYANVAKDTDASVTKVLAEFTQIIPQLSRPKIMPNDSPAVKAQKEAAQKEFDAEHAKYTEAVTESSKSNGTMFRDMAVGMLYRNHITPRLQKNLTDANARIQQLEAELGKLKKAGSFKPASTPKPAATRKQEVASTESMEDSIAAAARAAGINIES